MKHNVNTSLTSLLVDIDKLVPLPSNPRVGNVDAIVASYEEFGQVKPIVGRPNEDGTITVIAGNHQLQVVDRSGWSHLAVIQLDVDEKRALAYAMADNRTVELGYTDDQLLADILAQISEDYSTLLDNLNYDAFEIASIQSASEQYDSVLDDGYIAPTIVREPLKDLTSQISVSTTDAGETKIEAKPHVDSIAAVTGGSSAIGASGSSKAVIQYTLVFDDAEQQRKWYNFIRWLRNDPAYDGETTAEKLMAFIDAHANS